jgi:glycosyltransferase involved in cell wall biosynthesis
MIVCDGGSTDKTIDIAREYGCTIIKQDIAFKYADNKIANFSGVRNQMLKRATYNWFFVLDSDEYASPGLVEEIKKVIETDCTHQQRVFDVPRKFTIDGEVIDCASVYPNYQRRFFHRDFVSDFVKPVNERVRPHHGLDVFKLMNYMVVPTSIDYSAIEKKNNYYLEIERQLANSYSVKVSLHTAFNSLLYVIKRCIKVCLSLVSCRGKRMPIRKEITAIKYSLRLSFYMLLAVFKRHK